MRSIVAILLLCPLLLAAQTTRRDSLRQRARVQALRIDSLLAEKNSRVNYDTAYIYRPSNRLTLKLRSNISGSVFHVKGQRNDMEGGSDVSTDNKATLSIGASYRGISAGLALNPGKLFGHYKDYELNLNAYGNRYGVDVAYQSSTTLSGIVTINGDEYFMQKGVMDMKMLSVNGYYAFNGRRFSYPAAFTQSYIQRRSAGSWLVGFSFLGGSLTAGAKKSERMPDYRIYVGHLGIGGGYGYNLVVGRKKLRERRVGATAGMGDHRSGIWLIHLSALPTLVISNRNNIKVDGQRRDMTTNFPDLILAEHAAIVRNFGNKYFAGATLVMTNSLLGDDDIDINYRKWRTRLFVGVRL